MNFTKASIYFAAGCLGGLANRLIIWAFGEMGINQILGVSLSPVLTPAWIYPAVVWGGIWGWAFYISVAKNNIYLKGIIISILPSLVAGFYVLPQKAGIGMWGIDLGMLMPALILFYNAVWGLAAAWLISVTEPKDFLDL